MKIAAIFFAGCLAAHGANARDFGAYGDGTRKDTKAIQRAIDATAKQGGGTVVIPSGQYLSGTLHLRSDITLHLEAGATLIASTDETDFDSYETLPFDSVSDKETTYFHYGLITAENVENIAIEGRGFIDGNRVKRGGPKTIAIKLCRHVSIRGVTVKNSPNYSISLWGSDYVDIDGVTILNGYSDGIDPDSCHFVRIANCFIDAYDDAICPKSSPSMGMERRRAVENLAVTNCTLRTNCSNFKFGTESSGGLHNVVVSNLTMLPREIGRNPIAGIAIESVDGAEIDGVAISNLTMEGVRAPVFLRIGNRGRGLSLPVAGSLRNVSIQNVIARGASIASSIVGIPGASIRQIRIDGFSVSVEGGGAAMTGSVPELIDKYPEATMFGELPAYGFFARHVDGLVLRNIKLYPAKPDARPALLFDDVQNLEQ